MRYLKLMSAILLVLSSTACSSLWNFSGETRSGVSSSLVDYLYPAGEVPPDTSDMIPHLQLPLRVGIAFVPGQTGRGTISEATKMQLLETVKAKFTDREYIEHIEVIPDTYLRSSKGINGMQQVARLYGTDVMALVSYDQVAVSEDNPASFLYWTIVGSYVIKATSNEVQTFVDTAVFDVDTARLLFRIQQDPQVAQTQWKPGHGGGTLGIGFLLVLVLFAGKRNGCRPTHRYCRRTG
jgi:rhombotail lipoprotein